LQLNWYALLLLGLYRCPICHQAQAMLDKRRIEELETFLDLQKEFQNEKSSGPLYGMSSLD